MTEWGGEIAGAGQDKSLDQSEWAPAVVPEWDEMLESSLELATSLLRARWCALFLLDRDRGRLVLARLWDATTGVTLAAGEALPGSLEWRVAEGGGPLASLRAEGEWLGLAPESEITRLHPCACVSVDVEDSRFGVVEVIRGLGEDPLLPADLEALQTVSRHLGLWLKNSAILQQLRELAITDGLTEVYNHRYFLDRLALEMERAARYDRPVSLVMLDLNRFKHYNDLFGHQQGDVVLHLTATSVRRAVRRIDVVARYGGDEFAVILPETSCLQALVVANRISHAVGSQQIPLPDGIAFEPLSASLGISSYPEPAKSRDELIGQADEALYRAKRSRGRHICLWASGRSRSRMGAQTEARLP